MTLFRPFLLLAVAAVAGLCSAVAATSRASLAQSSPAIAKLAAIHDSFDTSMFAPATECLACHNNLSGPGGDDLSIGASWRGSIMANAARDPYVHASVRREMIDHRSQAADIEDECATCHAPAAAKVAHTAGAQAKIFTHFSSGAGAAIDDLARDGVTCTVCHQIDASRLGTRDSFNGNFSIAPPLPDGRRRALGPFAPDPGSRRVMHSVTGFEQEQAVHVRESELCATCHTLITEARGPDGHVIGSLPEQMNYQEWRHSAYFAERRSCQSCHMPRVQGPVRVASVLGEYRDGLSRHTFLGGNAFMLNLMKQYRAELGVQATAAELDAAARATVLHLERDTADVAIERASLENGTLLLDVGVRNLTGHKFPTGYPARRTWLHVVVRDRDGRAMFESGRLTSTGSIEGNDSDRDASTFEPHYGRISSPNEVQIYESILGTPEGQPTTGLLQATKYLKDNRLLPRGFDKRTADAEIAVIGGAADDDDFAAGGDRVEYRIAASGAATVEVELRYQPIGYRWARNLAGYDAPEPRAFVAYYASLAPTSSVLVTSVVREIGAAPSAR